MFETFHQTKNHILCPHIIENDFRCKKKDQLCVLMRLTKKHSTPKKVKVFFTLTSDADVGSYVDFLFVLTIKSYQMGVTGKDI